MIPLFKVKMSENVIEKLSPVLYSGYIAQGSKVDEFEDILWKNLKSNTKPITVNSGTAAIDLALELCDVRSGDEVISTPQTCFATQIGAIHRGAKIRWADIDPLTGLIDPKSVEKLITPKTKAIISVDWAGKIADYKSLKSFGIPVIEDAAHCWDSFLDETVERGDYICYSLQAIKFLTTGDGGILIAPVDKERQGRILRWFGLDREKQESFRCTQNIENAGFKYHMNDISATIGIENIKHVNDSVLSHKKNAEILCKELKDIKYATVLPYDKNSSYWVFPLVLNDGVDRDDFILYLENNNIASSPVHFRNDEYSATLKFKENDLPSVTFFSKQQINIPVGWWVTEDEIKHIIFTVRSYKF
jgi:dTDP-4-amino-4,6-dideoxygalactose transaminase